MSGSLFQYCSVYALGYLTYYVKDNVKLEDVIEKSIDYYVDIKNLIKPIRSNLGYSSDSSDFWDSYVVTVLETNQSRDDYKYGITYKKDGRHYYMLSETKYPEISEVKSLSNLKIIDIKSKVSLSVNDRLLLELLLNRYAGYAGDFHGNVVTLDDLNVDMINEKEITEVTVNVNMLNQVTLKKNTVPNEGNENENEDVDVDVNEDVDVDVNEDEDENVDEDVNLDEDW